MICRNPGELPAWGISTAIPPHYSLLLPLLRGNLWISVRVACGTCDLQERCRELKQRPWEKVQKAVPMLAQITHCSARDSLGVGYRLLYLALTAYLDTQGPLQASTGLLSSSLLQGFPTPPSLLVSQFLLHAILLLPPHLCSCCAHNHLFQTSLTPHSSKLLLH